MSFPFVQLSCPSCNAPLKINPNSHQLTCEYCGNVFLRKNMPGLHSTEAAHPRPKLAPPILSKPDYILYALIPAEWVCTGDYALRIHEAGESRANDMRVLYVNVEYHNVGEKPINCRRNQWFLYDTDGHRYEGEYEDRFFTNLPFGQRLGADRTLTPGMNMRGWLAFNLKADFPGPSRLQFISRFMDRKTTEVRFVPIEKSV